MSSLEEEAERRRQRLKAMRKAQDGGESVKGNDVKTSRLAGDGDRDEPASGNSEEKTELPRMKFRSYMPKNAELQERVLPKVAPQELSGTARDRKDDTGSRGEDAEIDLEAEPGDEDMTTVAATKRSAPSDMSVSIPESDEVQLLNLAPRKPDWDLKRDVAKSLEKLERRTQRAIAEIIRERLANSESSKSDKEGDLDLAQAVTWGAKTQEEASFDDW